MIEHAYAVILAGGSGERFWPLSTHERPKQFVSLFEGKPLIRHAVDRLEGLIPPERILILTAENLVRASREACPMIPSENIVGEPCRRDTAAASALACGLVAMHDSKGVAIILTADQLMADIPQFRQVLADSVAVAAASSCIVTIGITPDSPSTGFGYIEAGSRFNAPEGILTEFCEAMRFVEKPDLKTANNYLQSGHFYWNSGMFIWSVETMAQAFRHLACEFQPLLTLPSETGMGEPFVAALSAIYPTLKKISVDYAIMEKYDNIVMARGSFGWDDVGSWSSISKHIQPDANGNVTIGAVATTECNNCVLVTEGEGRLTAVLGMDDVVVVQTPTATLVCPKSRAQDLKKLVQEIGTRTDGASFI